MVMLIPTGQNFFLELWRRLECLQQPSPYSVHRTCTSWCLKTNETANWHLGNTKYNSVKEFQISSWRSHCKTKAHSRNRSLQYETNTRQTEILLPSERKIPEFQQSDKVWLSVRKFQKGFFQNNALSGMNPSSFPTLDQIQRTN